MGARRHDQGLILAVALGVGLAAFALSPTGAESQDGIAMRSLRVELQDGRLTVEAVTQPWAAVLDELVRATGIAFRLHPRPEGAVTASIRDVPAERALRLLFGPDAQYVFLYRAATADTPSAGEPAEVWILGGRAVTGIALDSASAPAGADRDSRPGQIQSGVRTPAPILDLAPSLLATVHDKNPEARRQAAHVLGTATNDSVVPALAALLNDDPEPAVRAIAAAGLARVGSFAALGELQRALYDPERAVRLAAVQGAARLHTELALTLMRDALRDPDPAVQAAAARALQPGGRRR